MYGDDGNDGGDWWCMVTMVYDYGDGGGNDGDGVWWVMIMMGDDGDDGVWLW